MRSGLTCRGICLALVLFLAGLGLVLTPKSSHACSCSRVSPSEALESSYAVFMGTVASIRYHESGAGTGYIGETAEFEVDTVWKGPVSQTIYAKPSSYNSSCGFGFAQGATYLVYADSAFSVSMCSRTSPVSRATEDLAVLGEGQVAEPGTVSPASYGAGERLLTKAWADPTPPALEQQTRRQADPQSPSEDQTGAGCSRSVHATDVTAMSALGGVALFGLMRRRPGMR